MTDLAGRVAEVLLMPVEGGVGNPLHLNLNGGRLTSSTAELIAKRVVDEIIRSGHAIVELPKANRYWGDRDDNDPEFVATFDAGPDRWYTAWNYPNHAAVTGDNGTDYPLEEARQIAAALLAAADAAEAKR